MVYRLAKLEPNVFLERFARREIQFGEEIQFAERLFLFYNFLVFMKFLIQDLESKNSCNSFDCSHSHVNN